MHADRGEEISGCPVENNHWIDKTREGRRRKTTSHTNATSEIPAASHNTPPCLMEPGGTPQKKLILVLSLAEDARSVRSKLGLVWLGRFSEGLGPVAILPIS